MPSDIYIYLPLLCAALPFLVRGTYLKSIATATVVTILGIYSGIAAVQIAMNTGTTDPLMPTLDPLGALFVLSIVINGIACAIYSVGYIRRHPSDNSHTQISLHLAAIITLVYSMIRIVASTEAYDFLLWWEVMTMSTFVLLLFDARTKAIMHAAMGFLVVMHVGFFMLLAGFATTGSNIITGGSVSLGIFVLLLIGFGLKSAIFPLHIWLPPCYKAAPSHISALLSGVSINMGIYGLMRSVLAIDHDSAYVVGVTMFIIGVSTALFGVMRAATQYALKRLLSYSSIENVGIVCIGLGIGTVGRATGSDALAYIGYGAAMIHTLGHSNYKTLLFFGVGSIENSTRTTDMNHLGGLLRRMPISGSIFLLGALAICAVPPLVGFASEFVLLGGLFDSIATGHEITLSIIGITTLALVGGLSVMTFTKAFGITFLGAGRSTAATEATEADLWMLLPAALPAAGIIAGPLLYGYLVLENCEILFGTAYNAAPMLRALSYIEVVALGVAALTIVLMTLKFVLNRVYKAPVTVGPTWGCAFGAPNRHMQYTATSYNRDLQNSIAQRSVDSTPGTHSEQQDLFPRDGALLDAPVTAEHHSVTHYFSRLMHRWTARLALFQTGKANDYILHALLFLVFVLILTLLGAI